MIVLELIVVVVVRASVLVMAVLFVGGHGAPRRDGRRR